MRWNHEVDRALVSQVPEDEIRQIKNEFITDRIRQSIDTWGNGPELLQKIIFTAIKALALLISRVLTAIRELKNKLFHETLEKPSTTAAPPLQKQRWRNSPSHRFKRACKTYQEKGA